MVARSLFDFLDICSTKYSERDAFVFGDTHLSYSYFLGVVNRLANGLSSLHLQKGDRLALMLPNLPQFPIAYYALLKLGLVVVPINVMFRENDIRYILADASVKGFIAWGGFGRYLQNAARDLPDCRHHIFLGSPANDGQTANAQAGGIDLTALISNADARELTPTARDEDPAVILYTSGTTGPPRGALLTHANLAASVLSCWEAFRIDHDHRFAAALPLFHGIGQMLTMNVPLAAGACSVLLPRFDAMQMIETIAREQVTHLVTVPAMLRHLLAEINAIEQASTNSSASAPVDTSLKSLQALIVTGTPVDDNLRHALMQRFGVDIFEGYGLAECSPLVTANRPDITNKHGSVGKQLPGLEFTIVDEKGGELPPGEIGEIVVRGAAIMPAYHNRNEDTQRVLKEGWLYTGDIGRVDESGYLYLIDRKTDVIKKAGFYVFPLEVERCLLAHPEVSECAVIGVPAGNLGQEVKAYVVLKRPQAVSAEELIRFCKAQLPAYKCPRSIEFWAELPHGPTGKILKRLLRERVAAQN